MTYQTKLTDKCTTTIPKEIRDELGLGPGMYVLFTKNTLTGEYTLKKTPDIHEIRAMNKAALHRAGTARKEYKSGDGYSAFVSQKYGAKS